MGSQHKKKKKTTNVNVVVADIQDTVDQQATKDAIQPAFEGTTYMPPMRAMIDFVNVTETIDPSQTPA